ncbi:MAG: acetyl-CoA carboxylase carboxyltransferase subunit alpha [Coriobacteriia bacterium]|nr:acetyl-CoA carboxylase carboxyltransferase subunit alpha [Coriobacteriia bacterium]
MSIFDHIIQRRSSLDNLAEHRNNNRKKASGRIRIKTRSHEVLDYHTARPLFEDITSVDPLSFPGYAEKAADLTRRSGRADAFSCVQGTIEGHPVICVELLADFLMGSMGTAVGEAVCRSAELASKQKVPLIVFSASGGARMQEGMFSLMQMAKTSAAIRRFSDAGGLYLSIMLHPTTGGVTASFASQGDIIIAEPGALIGFAGPRVIEQTIRTTLPEGFQRAEFQKENGFVDMVVPQPKLRNTLSLLLQHHNGGLLSKAPAVTGLITLANQTSLNEGLESSAGSAEEKSSSPDASAATKQKTPFEHVELSRHLSRPRARAFISQLFDDFIELHGDRQFRDDPSLIAGVASFAGLPVTVAAHLKGSNLNENIGCNFGMPHPEGYRKFIRLAKQADKFGRPIITLIDTPGAYPGAEAEERGQGEAIARCLFELSGLKVPVIAVVTGEGGSGGALALGLADRIYMYENAVYSVLSPEGFASILWKDASLAEKAASVMKMTAQDLLGFEMIDGIIKEPVGGAHKDPVTAIETLRAVLHAALVELCAKDEALLLAERYQKYRKFS